MLDLLVVAGVFILLVALQLGLMSVYCRARRGRFEVEEDSPRRFVAKTDIARLEIERQRHRFHVESRAGAREVPFHEISKLAYRYWRQPRGWMSTDWYEIALVLKSGEELKVYVAGQGGPASFRLGFPFNQEVHAWLFGLLSQLGLVRDMEQRSREVLETFRHVFLDAGLELHLA